MATSQVDDGVQGVVDRRGDGVLVSGDGTGLSARGARDGDRRWWAGLAGVLRAQYRQQAAAGQERDQGSRAGRPAGATRARPTRHRPSRFNASASRGGLGRGAHQQVRGQPRAVPALLRSVEPLGVPGIRAQPRRHSADRSAEGGGDPPGSGAAGPTCPRPADHLAGVRAAGRQRGGRQQVGARAAGAADPARGHGQR